MNKSILVLCLLLTSLSSLAADSYDRILARLQELDKLPNTTLFTLGKNDQGRDIIGIMIGDVRRRTSIKNLVVGTHHGNERSAAEVPLLFVEQLSSSRILTDIYYVIPVLNISGYNANNREELGSDGKSHDPNRDYQDACKVKPDFKLRSTSLIADFMRRENIVSAVTVHGYVGTFTYPWGTFVKDYATQDDHLMNGMAKAAVKVNNYAVGTHGAQIYPAAGAFEDWAYFKLGVWSFLLEINRGSPDLRKDAQALIEFFKVAPRERSTNLGQTVSCVDRILRYEDKSRP